MRGLAGRRHPSCLPQYELAHRRKPQNPPMSLADVVDNVLGSWSRMFRFLVATVGFSVAVALGVRIFLFATHDLGLEPEEMEFSSSPRVVLKRKIDGSSEYVLMVQPQDWQNTGIRVKPNDEVTIRGSGSINISMNGLLDQIARRRRVEARILARMDSGKIALRADSSRLPERYYEPADYDSIRLVRDWTGPAGYPGENATRDHRHEGRTANKVLPEAPYGALLGAIHTGSTPPVRSTRFSESFVVGDSLSMSARRGGTLWLVVNDVWDDEDPAFPRKFYIDNLGFFLVKVQVRSH